MSIFQLADKPAAPSFEAMIAQCTQLRLAEQQAMIADVEALLGKLAKPAVVAAPKPRRRRKRIPNQELDQMAADCRELREAGPVKLNAVGKPYSPQYDPKYRMKYRTPKTALPKPGTSTAASIRDIDGMRAHIASYWSA